MLQIWSEKYQGMKCPILQTRSVHGSGNSIGTRIAYVLLIGMGLRMGIMSWEMGMAHRAYVKKVLFCIATCSGRWTTNMIY